MTGSIAALTSSACAAAGIGQNRGWRRDIDDRPPGVCSADSCEFSLEGPSLA